MRKLIYMLSAVCFGLVGGESAAQEAGGAKGGNPYAGIQGGVTFVSESILSFSGASFATLDFDTGFNFGGMIGYKFANGFRVEGEYSYRQADMDSISALGMSANVNGEVEAHAFMLNAWYEPALGGAIFPYVGGGLGVGLIDATIGAPGIAPVSDDDVVFAYQVGAGVGYEVSDGLVGYLDYRYWATADFNFRGVEAEFGSHNVSVGIRYHF